MDSLHCYSRLEEDETFSFDNKKMLDNIDPPVVLVGTWKDAVPTSNGEQVLQIYESNLFT